MLGLRVVLKFWLPWTYKHLCIEFSFLWFSVWDMHAPIGQISFAWPKGDSFSFIFLPGRSLHGPHSLLDFPYRYTKANKRALWTIQHDEVAAVASDVRGDLWSLTPGEDAAEQCHPCSHSFKSVPGVSPSPCAARPPHRLTKGCIHQPAATGYNPFERQQAVPALPGLGLKCSSFLAHSSPGPPWLIPAHVEGFEGLRTHWGDSMGWERAPWVSKSCWSGYISCGSSLTCVPGAAWFHAHTLPTDKLLLSLAALDGVNLLCISSLNLFMVGLLPFVPVPALAISLESSPQCWI